MNDKKFDNVRFDKVNSMPAVGEHLTAKYYVDQLVSDSVDEPTLVRNNQDNDFSIYNFTNLNSIILNTPAVNDNKVITNSYIDQFLR